MGKESDISGIASRLAAQIVESHLDVPAMLFLEMHRPFANIFHTSVLFAQPFVTPFIGAERVEGLLTFLNNPQNIELLIAAIEEKRATA